MTKDVTFNLGPTTNISTRQLTITRMHNASDGVSGPAAAYDVAEGVVDNATARLANNQIWEAELVDITTGGHTKPTQVLHFQTGDLTHLGPRATSPSGSEFYILDMSDLSSSSSVSSSSVSSSSGSSVSSVSSVSSSSSSVSSSSASSGSSSPSSSSPSSVSSSSSSSSSSSVSSSSVSSSSASSVSSSSSPSSSSASSSSSPSSSSASSQS